MLENLDREPGRREWFAFWKLVLIQTQNTFNEKGAQFLLIPLAVWLYGQKEGDLEYPLGAIIVLPFVIFSPLVGWLSDRFCKARVIQSMAVLQVIVLLGMFWSLRQHHLNGALFWFCVFAVQATIFSPSKKGIVKDIAGARRIGFASGIVEMASVLAILVGQIGAFSWFSYLLKPGTDTLWHRLFGPEFFHWFDSVVKPTGVNDGWYAASFPCLVFLLLAVPVACLTFTLPRYKPYDAPPFRWRLLYEHFTQIKDLWKSKALRFSGMGIGYFWFFGGTVMLMTIQISKAATGGGDDFGAHGAFLMAWMSGGTVLGGVVASCICRSRIKMSLALSGGFGMALACFLLAASPENTGLFYACLAFAGVSAACYLVPQNAFFQDSADNDKRGNVIAAGNLVDCFLGLLAVAFQYMMMQLISPSWQFVVMGGLSLLMTLVVFRLKGKPSPVSL